MIDNDDDINKIYELLSSGNLKDAEMLINNLSKLNSEDIELLNLKGELFRKLGKHIEAKDIFIKVKELSSPNIPIQVFLNLADTHIALKEYDDAEFIYNNIITMNPNNIATLNGLGRVLVNKMMYQQALSQFNKAYALDESNHQILFNIAYCLKFVGEHNESIDVFKKYLNTLNLNEIDPEHLASIYLEIGINYLAIEEYDDALHYITQSKDINPNNPHTLSNLGLVYAKTDRLDEAELLFVDTYNLDKTTDIFAYNYCHILLAKGKDNEAKEIIERFISENPKSYRMVRLIEKIKFKKSDNMFNWVKDIHNNSETPLKVKIESGFGMFSILDKEKEYKQAFEYLFEANNLYNEMQGYSYERILKFHEYSKSIRYDDNTHISDQKNYPTPIFIVGMPRSGTTLTEQILDSHSLAYGAGELRVIEEIAKKYEISNYSQKDLLVNKETLKNFQEDYFEEIKPLNIDNKPYFVDKMPGNYLFVSLIKAALPWSKIIHCKRNPMDTCLSIYTKKFVADFHAFYSLDGLALSYISYNDLMHHWYNEFAENTIFDVTYEKLLDNPEEKVRGLLSYLGLEYEGKCLEFYKNERFVKTASSVQVRKKLYNSSVDRWKNYKNELDPLYQKLKEAKILN
tara:strand:- start:21246 stop:23132 length:1887 start_codon:yes stop_codon:yes gene_type:complete